jgi:prepilin-type N-terminal cleavage/methylation domain-containing protein
MNRYFSARRKGFTLIEILVVLSIVGILLAILVANFSDARKQSRDKVRKVELKELQLAVEVYKAQYGMYPAQGCGNPGTQWAGRGPHPSWGVSCDEYILGLVPSFIAELPSDPNREFEEGRGFIYMTNATRSAYKILVHDSVESIFVRSFSDEFARCPGVGDACPEVPQTTTYGVYSVGAEGW